MKPSEDIAIEVSQDILCQLPQVVMKFDSDFRCTYYNGNNEANPFGIPGSLIEGRRIEDILIAKELKSNILGLFNRAKESNRTVQGESKLSWEGTTTNISTTISPLLEGEIITFILTCIPHFTAGIEKVNKTEVLDELQDLALVIDEYGNIVYANKPFLGESSPSLVGQKLEDFFLNEDKMVVKAAMLRVFQDGISLNFENHAVVSDTPRWFSNSMAPFTRKKGAVTEILLLIREVSGMKNQIRELRAENRLQQQALSRTTDGVMGVDIQGMVTLQNPVCREIFGPGVFNLSELRERFNTYFIDPVSREQIAFEEFVLIKALRGDESVEQNCFQVDSGNRAIRNLIFTAKSLMGSQGEITGAILVIKDITHDIEAQQKLINANKNLDHFVHAVAHDLKSPVVNMRNLFRLMEASADEGKKAMLLDKIKSSAHKLDDLLGALMELVEAQKNGAFSSDIIAVREVYDAVIDDLQDEIMTSKAKIVANFNGLDCMVYNRAYLRSVFYNLISNAIKYRSQDRTLNILVSMCRFENGDVELRVKDNGQGIDLEFYGDEIFKPFKRLTSKGPGKGIGLNLIKNAVEKNGGTVQVKSKKGQGAEFILTLKPYDLEEA